MFRLAAKKLRPQNVCNYTPTASQLRLQSTATTAVPESADVVIIGGGSAGCNTLYHLSKLGVKAVLLDRSKATAGTTWHTTGVLWRLRHSDVDIPLLNATLETLKGLEAETGMDPGWTNNGGLYIANTKERLDEYRRVQTTGKSFGIESALLDPKETQALFPLIDPSVIVGSLFSPGDGFMDPAMMCAALIKASQKNGAKVIENCPVSQIQTGNNLLGTKQVTGVVTPHGLIKTNCVVNCAGVWSREVAAMVGLSLPLLPSKHAYVVTEGVKQARGMPNIRAPDDSFYIRIQGEALCLGGYEPNPIIQDKVASDFNFSLYELDWNVFNKHMEGATKVLPIFKTTGIKTTVCGSESFTPDHKPLMGEDPRLNGLYHGCGYNSVGMMLGGGCGQQLAQWVANGRPDLPMYSYDIRRFSAEQRSNSQWLGEKIHEAYAMNFSVPFPNDEPLAARDFKQYPTHKELVAAGAVMEEHDGWECPGWFLPEGTAPLPKYDWYGAYGKPKNTDTRYWDVLKGEYTWGFSKHHDIIGQEALACREQVALFDVSYFGKMYLSGPEAQKAADWIFTANTRQPIGKSVYTCMLNKNAGVEGDVTVSAVETGSGNLAEPGFKGRGFYITVNGSSGFQALAHIQSLIDQKGFKAELTDVVGKIGVLSIQGPNSRELLSKFVDSNLSDQHFPASSTQLVSVAGHKCRALRISFVGELGYELHVPWDSCLPVYEAIVKEGSKHGLRLAGRRALSALSTEKGCKLWHYDLRSDDTPLDAGLGSVCREDGEYYGKAALDAARKSRVVKQLAFFTLDDQVQLWGLEAIWRDNKIVGYLRKGDYGYALGRSIGKGYVRHHGGKLVTADYLETGSYEIEVMGKRHKATLHLKSPFDPLNKRLLGNYEDPIPIKRAQ